MRDGKTFEIINVNSQLGALLISSSVSSFSFSEDGVNEFFMFSLILTLVLLTMIKSDLGNKGTRTFTEMLILIVTSVFIGFVFKSIELVIILSMILSFIFPFYKRE